MPGIERSVYVSGMFYSPRIYSIFIDPRDIYTIMDAYDLSLRELHEKALEKDILIPEITLCLFIYTIISQLEKINEAGMNHNDIKPHNIGSLYIVSIIFAYQKPRICV